MKVSGQDVIGTEGARINLQGRFWVPLTGTRGTWKPRERVNEEENSRLDFFSGEMGTIG